MSLEDEFGDIISKARVGQGCTPDALAKAAGLPARQIEDIEEYRFIPDPDRLRSLAHALELHPDKLLEASQARWTPEPVELDRGALVVDVVEAPAGAYSENCYVLTSRDGQLAAVVDPGGAVDRIESVLQDRRSRLDVVLITHAHSDHTLGLRQLVSGRSGLRLVSSPVERDSVIRGLDLKWEPASDRVGIPWAGATIMPLATPGHTPGSTCFGVDGVVFVGDNLFAGSIGRPSGPSVYRTMLESIRAKVLSLSDDTVLLPGHGPATDVGQEKAHNPFF